MTAAGPPSVAVRAAHETVGTGLDFLWLELTNRCNLQCVHCYTESSPHTGGDDVLTTDDYLSVMTQAYELGCRRMQFIGGEPQLNRDFQHLLVAAKEIGFEFVEVFTNLTRLPDETVRFAQSAGIRFATSVYSERPEVHHAITRNRSSHARTVKNLKRLIDSEVVTRAAVIVIDQEPDDVQRTKRFLADLGVSHIRDSPVREFGRGEQVLSKGAEMSGLCGHCWSGRLCVAPDGNAYPCVMARQWPVGNVLESPLAEIVRSQDLAEIRGTIYETVWLPKLYAGRPADGHMLDVEKDNDETSYPDEGEPTPPNARRPAYRTPSRPTARRPATHSRPSATRPSPSRKRTRPSPTMRPATGSPLRPSVRRAACPTRSHPSARRAASRSSRSATRPSRRPSARSRRRVRSLGASRGTHRAARGGDCLRLLWVGAALRATVG
jgi:MoaA/NifB/PqqE/SkfB family radical SAM enzyme